MTKFRLDLHSRTTPHTWLLRASFGVSFMSYTKKNDRNISGVHRTKPADAWAYNDITESPATVALTKLDMQVIVFLMGEYHQHVKHC